MAKKHVCLMVALGLGLVLFLPAAGRGQAGGVEPFVATRFDDPQPDGCSPTDCSLREAVIAANSRSGSDVIALPAGTYMLEMAGAGEDAAATGDLDITDDLNLLGAGREETVIDGAGIDRVFQAGDPSGSREVTVAISDLTMRNGHAVFMQGFDSGSAGGLFVRRSVAMTANRVVISDNRADVRGGGIYTQAGGPASLTVVESSIANNEVGTPTFGTGGGGVYNEVAAIFLDTAIVDNHSPWGVLGVGVWNAGGSLTLEGSTVSRNEGGVFNGGILTVVQTVVSENSGGGIGGNGRGITITGSVISNNTTGQEGAGINFSGDPGVVLSITDSTISGNSGARQGGGVFSWFAGTVEMTNVTVSGNSAGQAGGGLYIQSGNASLTNVTVSHNTSPAGATGSGIFSGAADVSLVNTVVAGGLGGENCSGAVTSDGHNLDDGTSCGFSAAGDLTNVGAMLGPLADNGGATMTHALLMGSPAIDGGDNTSCPATDQRGAARPFDGDGNGMALCDIGAYEFGPFLTPGDVNCDHSVTSVDAALVLQLVATLIDVLSCGPAADVNEDGEITSVDAALILQLSPV